MRVGIVGGGLMGLALAERLGAMGHEVCVYERADQPGGLATWHDFGSFVWDRFYHVILPSDRALLEFIRRIGLGDRLRWGTTRTAYYVDRRLHSISTGLEFLRFPLLSLWSKFRLVLTVLYCSRVRNWRRLERVSVEEFLIRCSGRSTFESFWRPLLLAKLGDNYRRVSAVFIWTYVKRLFSARDATSQREQLGFVSGGYKTVFERLLSMIADAGGTVLTGVAVQAVRPCDHGGIEVVVGGQSSLFDKVIFTGPVDAMRQVADPRLVDVPPRGDIEYLGVVCMTLVTTTPIVPYYIVNIADDSLPFTGIIGMSSLVPPAETSGLYLTYLPKYILSTDPMLQLPDNQIRDHFMLGFSRMFPEFDAGSIKALHINRAAKVQPLQVLDYSSKVQLPATRNSDFYVVNTAQFVSNTLNNNEVIRMVHAFLDQFGPDFATSANGKTGDSVADRLGDLQ